jgi:hypothetical protein
MLLAGVRAPEHAGQLVVRHAALVTALGPTAFGVWALLTDMRETSRSLVEARGALFAGIDGMSRMLKARGVRAGHAAIERALGKLRKVGLLEVLGWQLNSRDRSLFWRRAYGILRTSLDAACVPAASFAPLALAWERAVATGAGHRGGKRVGSGRPKGSGKGMVRHGAGDWGPADRGPRDPLGDALARSRASRGSAHLRPQTERGVVESNEVTLGNQTRDDLRSLSLLSSGSNSPSENTAVEAPAGLPRSSFERPEPRSPTRSYRSLSVEHLVVRVPHAPLLNPDDSPERHAALVRDWYVGACERIFPKDKRTVWAVKNKPTQRTKYHARLVSFAAACLALEVRPAAWIHYVVSQWRHMDHDKAPPLMLVLSTKKLEAECKTYDEEGRTCAREQYTDSAFEHMTREKFSSLGLREYPRAERDAALEAIRVEVNEGQAKVNADVKHGVWVWR